jgi:hypothetical protein
MTNRHHLIVIMCSDQHPMIDSITVTMHSIIVLKQHSSLDEALRTHHQPELPIQ